MEYTAIVKRRGEWWIGWIQEVPGITCQERTREELMETLAVTLGERCWRSEARRPDRRPGTAMRRQRSPLHEAHDASQAFAEEPALGQDQGEPDQ